MLQDTDIPCQLKHHLWHHRFLPHTLLLLVCVCASVRWKALRNLSGWATRRHTLPGSASTWASLAGSCTTGTMPTWPYWLIIWRRRESWESVSSGGGGGAPLGTRWSVATCLGGKPRECRGGGWTVWKIRTFNFVLCYGVNTSANSLNLWWLLKVLWHWASQSSFSFIAANLLKHALCDVTNGTVVPIFPVWIQPVNPCFRELYLVESAQWKCTIGFVLLIWLHSIFQLIDKLPFFSSLRT